MSKTSNMGGEGMGDSQSQPCDAEPQTSALTSTPAPSAAWRPIETAPKDGTTFLALQDGEVWLSRYGDDDGRPYLMRRTHERRQERSYRVVTLSDSAVSDMAAPHKVLLHEGPDTYEFHWTIWSRGFDFEPTHWMPIPPLPAERGADDGAERVHSPPPGLTSEPTLPRLP